MKPLLSIVISAALAQAPGWPQWGGPSRDFKAPSKGLAASWPAAGPRPLWSRDLGEGYSAIAADETTLYTLYRPAMGLMEKVVSKFTGSNPEVVVALDAATGATKWEHSYEAPFPSGMKLEHGAGPHSTPLLRDDLMYAVGTTGKLHALDRKTGRVVWAHDLWGELKGKVQGRGYSCSPIAYGDTIILTLGGAGQALAAFRAKDGSVVWKNGGFDPSPSSPLLINVDGQDQLVVFNADAVAGVDPGSGATYWSHPHKTDWGLNISTPVWGEDKLLFLSSAYSGGSRVLELGRDASGKTAVKELWFSNKMRLHFGNAVRIGDHVYGSSGDFGPAFFTAIHVRSGALAWQERGLARASFVYADGRFVLVDEDGTLALATATPEGLRIQARAAVLSKEAWTVPTLVGTRLYLRDRAKVMAFDLG